MIVVCLLGHIGFHVCFDGFKGSVADVMLNLAGILCGGFLVYTKGFQCGCQHSMPLVDSLRQSATLFG